LDEVRAARQLEGLPNAVLLVHDDSSDKAGDGEMRQKESSGLDSPARAAAVIS
jgi:hypothetical protein